MHPRSPEQMRMMLPLSIWTSSPQRQQNKCAAGRALRRLTYLDRQRTTGVMKTKEASKPMRRRKAMRGPVDELPAFQSSKSQCIYSFHCFHLSRTSYYHQLPSFRKVKHLNFLGLSPLVLLTMHAPAGHGYPCHSLFSTVSPAYSLKLVHRRCLYR